MSFMSDYDCFLTQRGLRRVMGDRVSHTFPITIDILLRIFHSFQPRNVFHACIRAAFLVAFFSFLRIFNLVPYTLSEVHSSASFFLRSRDKLLLSQPLVLTFLRPRPFSSSKRSWRYLFHFVPGKLPPPSLGGVLISGSLAFPWLIKIQKLLSHPSLKSCL